MEMACACKKGIKETMKAVGIDIDGEKKEQNVLVRTIKGVGSFILLILTLILAVVMIVVCSPFLIIRLFMGKTPVYHIPLRFLTKSDAKRFINNGIREQKSSVN